MSFDRGMEALDLASEALFQALGDNAYELDRDFRFLTFNAGCVAYYGRVAEAALGRPIWAVLEGMRGSWLEPWLREAMATRRPMRIEREGVARPDRWLEITAFPTARGLGVAFRDRTAEHRAMEALRQSEARQAFLLALEEQLRGLADSASPRMPARPSPRCGRATGPASMSGCRRSARPPWPGASGISRRSTAISGPMARCAG